MTNINIIGTYLKEGNSFFNERYLFKLILAKRLKTNNKPSEFLILRACCGSDTLPDGKKERYVSSIFWKSPTTFGIDFEGIRYVGRIEPNTLIIEPATTEAITTEATTTEAITIEGATVEVAQTTPVIVEPYNATKGGGSVNITV